MRAAVLRAVGDDKLDVSDRVTAQGPGPGQVRVRIAATGVCHSDLSGMNGTIPTAVPAVLGHEGAGEIIAIGDGVIGLAEGDHVIISWMPPCGTCADCLRGQPQLCMLGLAAGAVPHFTEGDQPLFAFAGTGTFAEEIVVSSQAAV
jgi:S-(hydroxymethyl)glutathione dehydrogenase/alcohol dehydrogenase